jgi:hypothetical protein
VVNMGMENNCGIWTGGLIAGYYIRRMSYTFTQQTGSWDVTGFSLCSNSAGDRLALLGTDFYYTSQIYTSSDYGETWTARESLRIWYSICSNSAGDRLAACENGDYYVGGRIYTSSDYGETWTARDSDRYWTSICSNSAGDRLAAVVSGGQIYTSSDYGESWNARESSRAWTSICSNSAGDRLAALVNTNGLGGRIYTSSDYGVTWTARDSVRIWNSICSNSLGDRLAASVYNGRIYTSSDYGETWTVRDSVRFWYSICSNSLGDRLAACVNGNKIYTSNNYGVTWTPRESVRYWKSICSNSAGDRLTAGTDNGYIYTSRFIYTYKNIAFEDMLLAASATAANNETVSEYKVNGTSISFHKPQGSTEYFKASYNASTTLYYTLQSNNLFAKFAPLTTRYDTVGNNTHGFHTKTIRWSILLLAGGGGGEGGVQYSGGGGGGGGGGGASGTWCFAHSTNLNNLTITIGGGGAAGTGHDNTPSYQYPIVDCTDGGNSSISNSTTTLLTVYGGNHADQLRDGWGAAGGPGGDVAASAFAKDNSITVISSSVGVAGSDGAAENVTPSGGTQAQGGTGGVNNVATTISITNKSNSFLNIDTKGNGGNGGRGEGNSSIGRVDGSPGQPGLAVIMEYFF